MIQQAGLVGGLDHGAGRQDGDEGALGPEGVVESE